VLTRTRAGKRVLFRIREGDPDLARLLEVLVLRRPLDSPPGPPRTLALVEPATRRTRQPETGDAPGRRPRTGGDPLDAVTIPVTAGGAVISDVPVETDSSSDSEPSETVAQASPSGAAAELEDFLL
jgi:hypothetical protein